VPDLTGLPALDLAIGLAFIFFLLSLLASAIQEQIAALLKLRAKTLREGLKNMLEPQDEGDAADKRKLVDDFYANPLIRSLYRRGRLPSYISPRSFALALIDTLAPNALAPDDGKQVKSSRDALAAVRTEIQEAPLPQGLKRHLLSLVDDARGEIGAFRKGLEAWFDDAMARVSGWYKRYTQVILLFIAIGITLVLNANTLTIGDRLWKDPAVRAAVVQQSAKATEEGRSLDEAADAVDSVAKLGLPLGWTSDEADPRHVDLLESVKNTLTILIGWLLTVGAIMLGAPFWFDTLSRFARLRSTGKPETPLPAWAAGQPGERVVT
jgi:hypothetical protein